MEEITFCIAAGFGAADNLVTTDWARANFGGAGEMACLALAAVWVAAAILATTLPNFTIFFASFFFGRRKVLARFFLFHQIGATVDREKYRKMNLLSLSEASIQPRYGLRNLGTSW